MKGLLFLLLAIASISLSAQKIYGTVFNDKGELLPYSSITIKGTTIGASANNRAKYFINVTPGTYTVVCQHIGYTLNEQTITVKDKDEESIFKLPEQKLLMKEVVVNSAGEDPAYAIIREAIKKRTYYQKEVDAFTCSLYTKDLIKLRHFPKKIFGKKIPDDDKRDMGLDTMGIGIVYLSESISKISVEQPDRFKLEVKSSRVSGSERFGFTFPTFISFYLNNVTIFTERLNPRGFISPIADGAIGYYRYKFLGSFWEDGKEINSIRVIPKRSYEPLFSGIINITEGDWRIHSVDLVLTKKSQLEILDSLQITQFHVPVDGGAWRVKNQLLHFNFNQFGIDAIGNFVSVYSNYNVSPIFAKGFFDRVVVKYDTGVSNKPKQYWDTIRPMPLEKEEVKDYKVKDSLYEIRKDSALSKHVLDSLKERQGKVKLYTVFWSGIDRTHYGKTSTYGKAGNYDWGVQSLIKNLEYNPAEGLVVNVAGYLNKELTTSKMHLSVLPTIRYGFSNKHLNGWMNVNLYTDHFESDEKRRRFSFNLSGGKRVTQFNRESPITPLVNSIGTLLYGDNLMKTYENIFGSIGYSTRFESGLKISISGLYEDRIPLNNTTNFTLFKKDTINLTPNYPFEKIATQFTRYQAALLNVEISIKPGQRFIQFPNSRISIGSKYPIFTLNYAKGFHGILGSDVDFDKWRFTISDDKNLKLAGLIKYKVGIGGFLNRKSVFIQDYQHFNGNRSVSASEYLNSFQLASYYANSTVATLYEIGHIEHHLNGLLTNKIPFFKKLNWTLVTGANAFYINGQNNYTEVFVGIENILKFFRVDFVGGYANGKKGITGIRIGRGGLIGGSLKKNSNSAGNGNSVSITF